MNYSPEPWRVALDSPCRYTEGTIPILAEDTNVGWINAKEDRGEENAKRAVTCVNACRKISTEYLERIVSDGHVLTPFLQEAFKAGDQPYELPAREEESDEP
jgi:hypothetical protein